MATVTQTAPVEWPVTQNAQITGTFLGIEDHGIPTFILTLDYGGSGQGFGMRDLRHEKYGIDLLMDVLRVTGCKSWEDLPGTYVRARATFSNVGASGHITKDEWLEPGGEK